MGGIGGIPHSMLTFTTGYDACGAGAVADSAAIKARTFMSTPDEIAAAIGVPDIEINRSANDAYYLIILGRHNGGQWYAHTVSCPDNPTSDQLAAIKLQLSDWWDSVIEPAFPFNDHESSVTIKQD